MTEFIDNTEPEKQKNKVPTEFFYFVEMGKDIEIKDAGGRPSEYDKVLLLYRNYCGYDVMLALNERSDEILYLGHWNDGCE